MHFALDTRVLFTERIIDVQTCSFSDTRGGDPSETTMKVSFQSQGTTQRETGESLILTRKGHAGGRREGTLVESWLLAKGKQEAGRKVTC